MHFSTTKFSIDLHFRALVTLTAFDKLCQNQFLIPVHVQIPPFHLTLSTAIRFLEKPIKKFRRKKKSESTK